MDTIMGVTMQELLSSIVKWTLKMLYIQRNDELTVDEMSKHRK